MTRFGWVEKVEADLKSELNLLGEKVNAQVVLGPYRSAFDKLLKEFRSLKPLLVQIKDAYEKALAESQNAASELGPLRSLVATVAEDCERKMIQMQQSERSDMNTMRDENLKLKKDIKTKQNENNDLYVQVTRLEQEVGSLYQKYRDEKCARRLLISDLNDQKVMTEPPMDSREVIDPVHMKLALEQCRKDLSEAQQTIITMKIEYAEVVPKKAHDDLSEKFIQSEEVKGDATKNLAMMQKEFQVLKETYEQVSVERDAAVKVRDDLGRIGTPRPEWEDIANKLDSPTYSSTDLSSKDKVQNIINDLDEAKSAGGPNYISTIPPDPLPEDWPTYLKSEKGSVKNRKLTPEETAVIIKELWRGKLASKTPVQWSNFLMEELTRRFNEASEEFAFSLLFSLRKYNKRHPHFKNFLEYLTGRRNEEEYVRIVSQSSDLLRLLQKLDSASTGSVTDEQFATTLRKAFPLKPAESINQIKTRFGVESDIKYDYLFEEDPTGTPSEFIRMLQSQDSSEKSEYIHQIKLQLEGMEKITMPEAKIAFMTIDPGIKIDYINQYLAYGLDGAESVPVGQYLSNLLKAPVYRVSPIPQSM